MSLPARFPPAPPGTEGWPWDAGERPGIGAPDSVEPLPRITVITPSLNQGEFIEETIRSIVMQGWPDLEYIVIDGGSTDGTLKVIRTYEPWIAYWVSEPDDGQADAINKGLRRATGDIVTWFNADDVYARGAFVAVAAAWRRNPRAIYAAPVANFDVLGHETLIRPRNLTVEGVVQYWSGRALWHDPGLFWSRAAIETVGEVDAALRYAFDYDYLVRGLQQCPVEMIDSVVARFRVHRRSKMVVGAERMMAETTAVSRGYWSLLASVDRAGFERAEVDLRLRRGFKKLLGGEGEGLRILWHLRRERPVSVARGLVLLVPAIIRVRLARLRARGAAGFR